MCWADSSILYFTQDEGYFIEKRLLRKKEVLLIRYAKERMEELITDDLMEEGPGMKDPRVSNNKWNAEPVDQMDCIVVIKIIPDVFPFEIAIVVVRVHRVWDWLAEFRIDLLENRACISGLLEAEEHKNAHVNQAESDNATPESFVRAHEWAFETLENALCNEHEERSE